MSSLLKVFGVVERPRRRKRLRSQKEFLRYIVNWSLSTFDRQYERFQTYPLSDELSLAVSDERQKQPCKPPPAWPFLQASSNRETI